MQKHILDPEKGHIGSKGRPLVFSKLDPKAVPTIFPSMDDNKFLDFDEEIVDKLHKMRVGWKNVNKRKCVAPQCCINNFEPHLKSQFIQFFPFPDRNSPLHRKWCQAVRNVNKNRKWMPPQLFNYMCAKHFSTDDFTRGNEVLDKHGVRRFRLRLKDDAVPKIFGKQALHRDINEILDPLHPDENVEEVLLVEAMEHDHAYAPPPKQEEIAFVSPPNENRKRKAEDSWVDEPNMPAETDNMEWMGNGKSRITAYGVESDFIPNLDLEEGDSDLVTFLKQKIIFQQQIIRDLQKENQRAHIVMNAFLKKDQLVRLGFDPNAW